MLTLTSARFVPVFESDFRYTFLVPDDQAVCRTRYNATELLCPFVAMAVTVVLSAVPFPLKVGVPTVIPAV